MDNTERIQLGKAIAESGKYPLNNGAQYAITTTPLDKPPSDTGLTEDGPYGAQLLDDLCAFLSRFIVYPTQNHRAAHAIWIAHCWWMDRWESTPRIAFLSPEPGSGKSRALEVTEPLVPLPVHAVKTTSAYLFRKVSDPLGRPAILYDECDTLFGPRAKEHEEVRGMINAGHRKRSKSGPLCSARQSS